MVVGTKTKNKKNTCVQLDCVINVVEIKPWPPSKSLISLRSALIQWEHGDKNSGSTKPVAPSYVSGFGVGDGKIEFNESFRLHVTLFKEDETFVKNCIELNLYEPRRDKTVKGQLLATAVVDLAEYGIVHESLMISVPMSCKRSFGSTTQPMLFVKIQMVERNNRMRSSSSRESLISQGSVSVLMNEEYAEEAENDSSMDEDDISSQSSMTTGSVTFGSNGISNPQRQNGSEAICGSAGKVNDQEFSVKNKRAAYEERISSSKDLYSELENARTSLSSIRNSRFTMLSQTTNSQNVKLSRSTNDGTNAQSCKLFQLFDASQSGQESQIIGDLGFDADRLKNVKSFGSLLDSGICNGYLRTSKIVEKLKDVGVNENKDVSKLQHLEQRVQNLEDELREAAAIEVSLYSVVAEHGSSINRVHAPARRLSRLYLHACKENSSRRTTSARSIVSGFVSVTKACGNDVPRLTFWLSNSIVLRAIIHKSFEKGNNETISLNESRSSLHNDWEDPCMVTSVLEKVESWIFTRIIESIWWQTLAPYMQTTAGKEIIRVVDSESNTSCQTTRDHKEVNTSLELWKTAFMDACERICPVRAAGRNCGCLSVLSMLIMEQCMSRLDVAMLNAILREPEDEGPTDPVSDPIGDARVLPIPSGKASFGAGAQLNKTIGNWSTWITDLFGSPITFHLLTALSELMMMPKDMLLSSTIRKEVCPTFGIPLIKRILDSFVPDEFCPDVIPEVVLEALASEDLIESSEDCITSLPCAAAPIIYHPPAASLIGCILGDDENRAKLSRSGSIILGKSNTSDDELDELDSPLTSIIDSYPTVAASKKPVWTLKDTNIIRYQLLKEMWMNSD